VGFRDSEIQNIPEKISGFFFSSTTFDLPFGDRILSITGGDVRDVSRRSSRPRGFRETARLIAQPSTGLEAGTALGPHEDSKTSELNVIGELCENRRGT
jgi:hypothetical protein